MELIVLLLIIMFIGFPLVDFLLNDLDWTKEFLFFLYTIPYHLFPKKHTQWIEFSYVDSRFMRKMGVDFRVCYTEEDGMQVPLLLHQSQYDYISSVYSKNKKPLEFSVLLTKGPKHVILRVNGFRELKENADTWT